MTGIGRTAGGLRVEAVFSQAIDPVLRHLGKRVVGPVEDRVLAEHGHIGRYERATGRVRSGAWRMRESRWVAVEGEVLIGMAAGDGLVVMGRLTMVMMMSGGPRT